MPEAPTHAKQATWAQQDRANSQLPCIQSLLHAVSNPRQVKCAQMLNMDITKGKRGRRNRDSSKEEQAHLKGPIGMPKAPAIALSTIYGSMPRSTSMQADCV